MGFLIAPALTVIVALSKDQDRSPGAHPPLSPALKHRQRCLPHPRGPGAGPHAQTLLAGLPREAEASTGHLEEAKMSEYVPILCPHPAFVSHLRCSQMSQVPSLGVGCLPTFIPRAQAGVLWEAQDVWGRTGSSGTWAGTWGGGPWTILLAPTTASELCIQLLPQCLPSGRLRPLAPWPRST